MVRNCNIMVRNGQCIIRNGNSLVRNGNFKNGTKWLWYEMTVYDTYMSQGILSPRITAVLNVK